MKAAQRLFLDGVEREGREAAVIERHDAPVPVRPRAAEAGLAFGEGAVVKAELAIGVHR